MADLNNANFVRLFSVRHSKSGSCFIKFMRSHVRSICIPESLKLRSSLEISSLRSPNVDLRTSVRKPLKSASTVPAWGVLKNNIAHLSSASPEYFKSLGYRNKFSIALRSTKPPIEWQTNIIGFSEVLVDVRRSDTPSRRYSDQSSKRSLVLLSKSLELYPKVEIRAQSKGDTVGRRSRNQSWDLAVNESAALPPSPWIAQILE